MFFVDKNIEGCTIVYLRHIFQKTDDHMLNKEITMFNDFLSVFHPFDLLTKTIFIEAQHKYLAFDHTPQQTSPQELRLHQHRSWVSLFEFVGSRMEDCFSMFWQRPEASRKGWRVHPNLSDNIRCAQQICLRIDHSQCSIRDRITK